MKSFATPLRTLLVAAAMLSAPALFAQSPRMVLIEEATNASCGPCAAQNPFFEHYLALPHNQAFIIPITYHANFPGRDVMNAANAAMHNARSSYYPITGVPTAIVNGRMPAASPGSYSGAPSDTVALSRDARSFLGTESPITLDISEMPGSGMTEVSVKVSSTTQMKGKLLRIVVVEGHHYYANAGTNGEKDFYYVARKMLPGHEGTPLDLNAGETKTFTQQFTPDAEWNADELYIVAFVQDPGTKEVLQVGTDRGRIDLGNQMRTSAVREMEAESSTWQNTLVASASGEYTVTVEENLPEGWLSSISIGGDAVSGTSTITLDASHPTDLNVEIRTADTKNGKGKVTVYVTGNRGISWYKSFTCYAPEVEALVITKDEGDARIADYYQQGMEESDYSYAVLERGDEDLFDLTQHVIVYEVGKWALETKDIANLKQLFDRGGMRVFMIGAEIGYGLADANNNDPRTPRDVDFLHNYLHADYLADDVPATGVTGVDGDPVSSGLSFSITSGIQNQDTPDELAPRDGAVPIFYYDDAPTRVAGIRYENPDTRLIYLGFGLEGIGNTGQRADVLTLGISWLLGTMSVADRQTNTGVALLAAQPNPAGSTLELPFTLERSAHVTIALYDLLGRQVATPADGSFGAGAHSVRLDVSALPAGTYMAVMESGSARSSRMVKVAH